MIQALLTDLDGVIRLWDGQNDGSIEREFGLPPQTLRTIAFAPTLLQPVITGQVSDETWRQQIAQQLAEQFPDCDAAAAVARWSAPAGAVDQKMLALLRRCRQRIPVGLITNATSRLPHDLERLGLTDEFDTIINSSVVGAAKPDRQIFLAALAPLRARPETTFYIDDSPGHVRAAAELGIVSHVYAGYSDTEQFFARYGILS
jgi:HAD superfamily hydrolase (TIGR01509 family)